MVHRALTNLEAVALAVRAEIESTEMYAALADRASNPDAKRLLRAMASDEEVHRVELMQLYQEMLGGEEPQVGPGRGERGAVKLAVEADYTTVFKAAYAKELDSERFYRDAAERVVDYKTRIFFLTLAETERGHAAALRRVLSRLRDDPEWLDHRNAAAIHLGP